jgi:hypothetical protein
MRSLIEPFDRLRPVGYITDCERIVKVARVEGYELTLKQAEELWENFSEGYCAGWLRLPDTDERLADIIFGDKHYHD